MKIIQPEIGKSYYLRDGNKVVKGKMLSFSTYPDRAVFRISGYNDSEIGFHAIISEAPPSMIDRIVMRFGA